MERDVLIGSWVHSHEEDAEGRRVFRPASFDFPPSRGREGFELRADGACVLRGPGPTDVPLETPGGWELEGEVLRLAAGRGGAERRLRVVSAAADRLVVEG